MTVNPSYVAHLGFSTKYQSGAKILDLNGMEMIKPLSLIIAFSHKIQLDWTENLAREVLKPLTTNGVA